MSSLEPTTSNVHSHVPAPLSLQTIRTNHSVSIDTLLTDTPEASSSPTVPQAPSEIVSIHTHSKSTKLPDFAFSCYSSSFSTFLASIHCLSEPSSYKEAILDPLWQQAMDEELSALHETVTWDLVTLPSGKSVFGCIRSRLILMGQLSDTKLSWL